MVRRNDFLLANYRVTLGVVFWRAGEWEHAAQGAAATQVRILFSKRVKKLDPLRVEPSQRNEVYVDGLDNMRTKNQRREVPKTKIEYAQRALGGNQQTSMGYESDLHQE